MRTCSLITLAACVVAVPLAARGGDWPQYRGPDRTGVSPEKGLLSSWPKDGPALVWTFDKAGTGYSGPAVVGGNLYIMGARDGVEYLIALDKGGKELWATKIAPVFDFKTNNWSRGPNATPTVDGKRLFALGSQGELVCVETQGGKEVWRKNLPEQLGAEVNPVGGGPPKMGWGFSWSPLVDGDNLICTPGGPQGLFAALDKNTGAVRWRSKEVPDQATYSSPLVAEVGGVRQYIALTQDGVVGVAARDGSMLWYHRRENAFPDVVIPTPIYHDGLVYVTAGEGAGAELLKLTPDGKKFKAKSVYAQSEISNYQGGVVLVGGHVYGFHEARAWECQDFATGTIKWSSNRRGLGAGSLTAADGHLYCLSEMGEVALVEASPDKYAIKSRFKLPRESKLRKLRGKVWTHPVIADGHLYLRDQDLIFCYKIK
jgi:outer membrane protein assembly factor BamB